MCNKPLPLCVTPEKPKAGGLRIPVITSTVKPCYSAPAFNLVPPIKHISFGLKKCFHDIFFFVGGRENLGSENPSKNLKFDQSFEMHYTGV